MGSQISFGKLLITFGVIMVVLGLLWLLAERLGFGQWFGKLPGDIEVKRRGFQLYIPWVSMLVISAILTIILNVIFRRR